MAPRDDPPTDGDRELPLVGYPEFSPVDDSDRSPADGAPDVTGARRRVVAELVHFANRLRDEGVAVPANGSLEAARALAVVGLSDRARVEAALGATLLVDAGGADAFEEAFPIFWTRLRRALEGAAVGDELPETRDEAGSTESASYGSENSTAPENGGRSSEELAETLENAADRTTNGRILANEASPAADGDETARRYSAAGRSEHVDARSARFSEPESAAVERFAAALAALPGRRVRSAPSGPRIDARRALRASLGTGGAPMELPRRAPVAAELRCCLLLDVSGSVLDTVDRGLLLAFAERLHEAARAARVFMFDTDLADATEAFGRSDGDPAAALRDAELNWGGGTRIGAALETLRRRHPSAVDGRTVVVVVSDGLDVGDGDSLEAGITWLSSRARAVVWLNPLAVSPAYEPTAGGMATCLPYVDGLFGFAEPADLADAARQLERRGVRGPVGYEYDRRR